MTKTYARRSFLLYVEQHAPTVRVQLGKMGDFTWTQYVTGSLACETKPYDPAPCDWAALALRMASDLDGIEESAADVLADSDEKSPAVEFLAELIGASQCNDCAGYFTNLTDGHCAECLTEIQQGACKCNRPDCGDCGRFNAHKAL